MTGYCVTDKRPCAGQDAQVRWAQGCARTARFLPRLFLVWFLSFAVNVRQSIVCVCAALGLFAASVHADAVQGCTSAVSGRSQHPASCDTSTSLCVAGCAGAAPFQDIITLAGQEAPELALHIIDQQQTSIDPLAAEWTAWEKARILIYQQRRDWASVVRRAQTLPDNLPLTFTRWALTQGAAAQLASGQGAAARAWLLRLIWQVDNADSQLLARPPWMGRAKRGGLPETRRAGSPSAGRFRHPASGDTCASMHGVEGRMP